jgi:hypothetical protein
VPPTGARHIFQALREPVKPLDPARAPYTLCLQAIATACAEELTGAPVCLLAPLTGQRLFEVIRGVHIPGRLPDSRS